MTYTSGNIHFTGLGNGTDFNKIREAMLKAQGIHKKRLETWKKEWVDKSKSMDELNAAMNALRTELQKLDTTDEFLSRTVSNTNTGALEITADAKASNGTTRIEVNQVAANDVWVVNGASEPTTSEVLNPAADASMTINYAGTDHVVQVPKGTSLKGLVNLINNNNDLRGKVRADTIDTGSGHRLQLVGLSTGAANTISITASTVPDYTPAAFLRTQQAANAKLKVNGYPTGADFIERASNTITDLVTGLTIKVKGTTSSAAVITTGVDKAKVKENVRQFVDGVNKVRILIQQISKVTKNGKNVKSSILTGNYGVQMLTQKLKDAVASRGAGFVYFDPSTNKGDRYSSLSQVGIKTDARQGSATLGQLKIDEKELDKALDEHFDDVARLFSANEDGISHDPDLTFVSSLTGTTPPGEYEVKYTVSGGAIAAATINGEPAAIDGWKITAKSGSPGQGLCVEAQNRADGSHEGNVSLRTGKIPTLADVIQELADPFKGTLSVIKKNYKNITDNVDRKIEYETKRLEALDRTLKKRFARLEATLKRYEGMKTALATQIKKLPAAS